MLISLYNNLKALWSRANDAIMRGAGRRAIPHLSSPEDVGAYLMAHGKYKGDKFNGILDNVTHPERFQYAMETGDWGSMPIDCDDYAVWAYRALMLIPECHPMILTLLDERLVGSHVVCAYRKGQVCGVIDTNGHRLLDNLAEETVCRVFSEVYKTLGYKYIKAVFTPYPF